MDKESDLQPNEDGALTIEQLEAFYAELEEERSASAFGANHTMARITRLQEEKAAMQMEALQYQRMMDEQSEYDQETLQLFNKLMVKREKEKQELERELKNCLSCLAQQTLECTPYLTASVAREEKEELERERKEALDRAVMKALGTNLKKAPERSILEFELYGHPVIVPDNSDNEICCRPTGSLCAWSQQKSLPKDKRDKIMGELAVRRSIAKLKGKDVITSSYDIKESSENTSSLPIRTEICESSMTADCNKCASTSANASGRSLNDRTEETTVTTGKGSPEPTVQHHPLHHPALHTSTNEQAHLQESNAKCRDNHNVGTASTIVSSLETTSHHQQSAAYAPASADIEAGAFTTCCEAPPETIAILNELVPELMIARDNHNVGTASTIVSSLETTSHHQQSAAYAPASADITCCEAPPETIAILNELVPELMIAGAFTLLSRNSGNLGPLEWVLLGDMTVGLISNFTWRLMGGRRRGRVSSLLEWTGVWSLFLAFFLIMTLLITH